MGKRKSYGLKPIVKIDDKIYHVHVFKGNIIDFLEKYKDKYFYIYQIREKRIRAVIL